MKENKVHGSCPWKDGFLFVGNNLALDFVNTRPVIDGEPAELLPDLAAVLRWFQVAGWLSSRDAGNLRKKWCNSEAATAVVKHLQTWRERLRSAVFTWEAGHALPRSTVEDLNRLMAEFPVLSRLALSGRNLVCESWFRPQTPDGLFAPLAHSAAALFARGDRSRVRCCGNCVLHFLDTSKKGTRRWCSMELCGNRLKVAAYAARQRKAKSYEVLG